MVSISLNVSSAAELEKCLDILDRRGLLNGSLKNPLPIASPFKKKGRATKQEMELRAVIDAKRLQAGLEPIAWRLDYAAREQALLEEGFELSKNPDNDEPEPETPEDTRFDNLDLENPAV